MKKFGSLQVAIRSVNALLTLGIVLSGSVVLLFPARPDRLEDLQSLRSRQTASKAGGLVPADEIPDLHLSINDDPPGVKAEPLTKFLRVRHTMPGLPVRLGGAVVEIAPNREGRVVTIGEEVDLSDNRKGISGWRLVRVETQAAFFADGSGVEFRVGKEELPTGLPGRGRPPFDSAQGRQRAAPTGLR